MSLVSGNAGRAVGSARKSVQKDSIMARLGKRERDFLKGIRSERAELIRETVARNLTITCKAETSRGFSSVRPMQSMTHGLYRGLYDPEMSSVRQTNRGLRLPKSKTVKAARASEVRHVPI